MVRADQVNRAVGVRAAEVEDVGDLQHRQRDRTRAPYGAPSAYWAVRRNGLQRPVCGLELVAPRRSSETANVQGRVRNRSARTRHRGPRPAKRTAPRHGTRTCASRRPAPGFSEGPAPRPCFALQLSQKTKVSRRSKTPLRPLEWHRSSRRPSARRGAGWFARRLRACCCLLFAVRRQSA
jgi:hypothetical protein